MGRFVIGLLVMFWALPAISSEISGTLKDGSLSWQSAQQGSNLVPAMWDIPINLPVAEKVILGGPSSDTTHNLVLKGRSGSVTVPLTIIGMQYKLSSYLVESNFGGGTAGTSTSISGSRFVEVMGDGVGNKEVQLDQLSNPFTHYRPVIGSIDSDRWMSEFKNKNFLPGIYQGIINYQIPYNYYRNGVIIRNTISANLTIKIDYPSQIFNVDVVGTGVITPYYYGLPERLVGGSTEYTVSIQGRFLNGVSMELKNTLGSESHYRLLSSKTPTTGIKYNVNCTIGCKGKAIITDGVPMITGSANRLIIEQNTFQQALARIVVSFSNQKLSEINNDTYRGNFVLIFNAEI